MSELLITLYYRMMPNKCVRLQTDKMTVV